VIDEVGAENEYKNLQEKVFLKKLLSFFNLQFSFISMSFIVRNWIVMGSNPD
jgi:hypothetical protein